MSNNSRKSKRTKKQLAWIIARSIFICILLGYIVTASIVTGKLYASQKFSELEIVLNNKNNQNFVTVASIESELADIPSTTENLADIDISIIEKKLNEVVNIEAARVNRYPNGKIKIDVTPVIPVARVFDRNGYSYYINKQGKKLRADAIYHIDVPVITGYVDDGILAAADLLPLVNYINSDSLWSNLTTALKIEKNHDVILIPSIKGHVVNLGDWRDLNIDNKFRRLYTMYREVLPHKGWQFYDTISVKFSGQVVASKTKKQTPVPTLLYELSDAEEVSIDNMIISPR